MKTIEQIDYFEEIRLRNKIEIAELMETRKQVVTSRNESIDKTAKFVDSLRKQLGYNKN